jgi:hypothetical protein
MSAPARFTILDNLVVQTYVVHGGRDRAFSHYEIHLAPTEKAARVILLTTDELWYVPALAAEGTDLRVDAAWRAGTRRGGQTAQLLVAMRPHQEAA